MRGYERERLREHSRVFHVWRAAALAAVRQWQRLACARLFVRAKLRDNSAPVELRLKAARFVSARSANSLALVSCTRVRS